jgi:hypothetical protein
MQHKVFVGIGFTVKLESWQQGKKAFGSLRQICNQFALPTDDVCTVSHADITKQYDIAVLLKIIYEGNHLHTIPLNRVSNLIPSEVPEGFLRLRDSFENASDVGLTICYNGSLSTASGAYERANYEKLLERRRRRQAEKDDDTTAGRPNHSQREESAARDLGEGIVE